LELLNSLKIIEKKLKLTINEKTRTYLDEYKGLMLKHNAYTEKTVKDVKSTVENILVNHDISFKFLSEEEIEGEEKRRSSSTTPNVQAFSAPISSSKGNGSPLERRKSPEPWRDGVDVK
jgi:hypothetical protein